MSDRLSTEQQAAVDCALQGANVRVRAVPGAGKTFTCLHLAAALEDKGLRVLQVTYTSVLKVEWREKRGGRAGFFSPHSFHSFAYTLHRLLSLGGPSPTDDDTLEAMLATEPPSTLAREYVADAILIDETQDCTPLYARLLSWYGRACGAAFQMVVVGQEDQAVYEKGPGGYCPPERCADLKYLTEDDAFGDLLRTREWRECPFTQSFRLTPVNAKVVNSLFGTSIRGCNYRDAERTPIWHCADMMFQREHVARIVHSFVDQYGPQHVQLVAPSWGKEGSNLATKHILNALSKMGLFFAEAKSIQEIQHGKTIIYTCSGCKGTEARCTIVLGADSFAWWVNRPSKFVAMTRAREQLVCIQHNTNLPWIGATSPQELIAHGFDVRGHHTFKCKKPSAAPPRMSTVTDLLRSTTGLRRLMDAFCDFSEVRGAAELLAMPSTVRFGEHRESLENLQGIHIPFEFARCETSVAPGFDAIFRPIMVTAKDKGKAAVDEVSRAMRRHGDALPARSDLERTMRLSVNVRSEQEIRQALENHLRSHRLDRYADLLITKQDYECKFPLRQRALLKRMYDRPVSEWSRAESAHAGLASTSFAGEHWLLHQVTDYDWAHAYSSITEASHARMRDALGGVSCTEFEVTTSFIPQPAKAYDSVPYPVKGITGRIDCVACCENRIFEFKFAQELTYPHQVQLFLYMCMVAARNPAEAPPEGILHNMRTGETLRARLRAEAPVEGILDGAIDLHFSDGAITPAAILARLQAPSTRKRRGGAA